MIQDLAAADSGISSYGGSRLAYVDEK